jgi:hypothetical protein
VGDVHHASGRAAREGVNIGLHAVYLAVNIFKI